MSEQLSDEVATLREQVALLRQVLDEVLVELTWANDNARDLPAGTGAISAVGRITSMSLNPTARDFQINSVPESAVHELRKAASSEAAGAESTQATLF
jgi:hypothetical protein